MEVLFSYGTLQLQQVQLSTFGRLLEGKPATLNGYVLSELLIEDADVVKTSGKQTHPIIYPGTQQDSVDGHVFYITAQELAQSDKYEVAQYQRVEVTLQDGLACWAYVGKPE